MKRRSDRLSAGTDGSVFYWELSELHLRRRCRRCDMLPRQRRTSACDKCLRLHFHLRPCFPGEVVERQKNNKTKQRKTARIADGRDDNVETTLVRSDDADEHLKQRRSCLHWEAQRDAAASKRRHIHPLFSAGAERLTAR